MNESIPAAWQRYQYNGSSRIRRRRMFEPPHRFYHQTSSWFTTITLLQPIDIDAMLWWIGKFAMSVAWSYCNRGPKEKRTENQWQQTMTWYWWQRLLGSAQKLQRLRKEQSPTGQIRRYLVPVYHWVKAIFRCVSSCWWWPVRLRITVL